MPTVDRIRLLGGYLRRDTLVLRRLSRALGDNLLLTGIARELKRRHPSTRLVVETTYPELFEHSPHVEWAVDARWVGLPGVCRPRYRIEPGATCRHILDQLYQQCGLPEGRTECRPEVHFSRSELARFHDELPSGGVLVCPAGKQRHAADRKEWGVERFQAVVDARQSWRWIQIGGADDPLLRGVEDRRGLGVRRMAGLMRQSLLFVGPEGGLMHLARAVDVPAVIVYGGAVDPAVTGYPQHAVLWRRPPCSPCLRSHGAMPPCPHGRECLTSIAIEEVVEAATREVAAASRRPRPSAASPR